MVKKNISYHELMKVAYCILQLDLVKLCMTFRKTSVVELCYHQIVDDQKKDQEMKEFVQVERLSAHDIVIDVIIMGIIEKHANDQSYYILEMNIVMSILLKAILASKNSPYNQFISHFNNVTIEFVFWG